MQFMKCLHPLLQSKKFLQKNHEIWQDSIIMVQIQLLLVIYIFYPKAEKLILSPKISQIHFL